MTRKRKKKVSRGGGLDGDIISPYPLPNIDPRRGSGRVGGGLEGDIVSPFPLPGIRSGRALEGEPGSDCIGGGLEGDIDLTNPNGDCMG